MIVSKNIEWKLEKKETKFVFPHAKLARSLAINTRIHICKVALTGEPRDVSSNHPIENKMDICFHLPIEDDPNVTWLSCDNKHVMLVRNPNTRIQNIYPNHADTRNKNV